MATPSRATANALIASIRENRIEEGLDRLYADEVVSVEPIEGQDGEPRSTFGLAALREKHAAWFAVVDMHACRCEGPFFHGNDRFGLTFETKASMKATGAPNDSREIAIYTVDGDGKIIREEFYEDV